MKITTLVLMTSLVFTLSACEESDDDGDVGVGPTINELPDDTTNGPTAGLAGLWDDTTDNGENGVDVVYLEFRSNNTGTAYDYQGDSFDQGDNCYVATELVIQNLGDDRYTIADVDFPNVGSPITANIFRGDLIVEDVEGTEILPALEGLSPTDFNICSEVPSETGNNGDTSIVGLWDATTEESSTGSNVLYLEFRSDNTGTAYNYQGDSFGTGDNCYETRELLIDDLGNSRYTITVAGFPDSAQTITADISGDNLLFTNGAGTDTLTALTGVSPSDFNICTEVPSETGNGGTADLTGLWDFSRDGGEDGFDTVYIDITSDNRWISYDYLGDSFDQGDNCYNIVEFTVEELGANMYRIVIPGTPPTVLTTSASVSNGNLILTDETGPDTIPPVIGLSATDFNPCR